MFKNGMRTDHNQMINLTSITTYPHDGWTELNRKYHIFNPVIGYKYFLFVIDLPVTLEIIRITSIVRRASTLPIGFRVFFRHGLHLGELVGYSSFVKIPITLASR
jgi:hypothetical protein